MVKTGTGRFFLLPSPTIVYFRVSSYANLMFSRPGRSQGLVDKHLCDSLLINWSNDPLVKISLWRHCALMVEDGAFSHKLDGVGPVDNRPSTQ